MLIFSYLVMGFWYVLKSFFSNKEKCMFLEALETIGPYSTCQELKFVSVYLLNYGFSLVSACFCLLRNPAMYSSAAV